MRYCYHFPLRLLNHRIFKHFFPFICLKATAHQGEKAGQTCATVRCRKGHPQEETLGTTTARLQAAARLSALLANEGVACARKTKTRRKRASASPSTAPSPPAFSSILSWSKKRISHPLPKSCRVYNLRLPQLTPRGSASSASADGHTMSGGASGSWHVSSYGK